MASYRQSKQTLLLRQIAKPLRFHHFKILTNIDQRPCISFGSQRKWKWFQPRVDVLVVCRSFDPTSSDEVADLFPSESLQPLLSIRWSGDPPREETVFQDRTGSDFEINLLPITTSNKTSPSFARPILIPTTPVGQRDPDRVPTPVSGRGDRKGHLFPVRGSSPTRLSHFPASPEDIPRMIPAPHFDHIYHHRSLSLTLSPWSRPYAMMHTDRTNSRYTPTSPLSPRLDGASRPISPQPSRAPRGQAARPMNIPIPKFHPLHFQQPREMSGPGSASSQAPIINYTKHSGSTTESPRLMKERQRDLIDKAKMSSRIAASPHGVKPDAPRLDPLGSPKGPVTPLALEEGGDYFLVAGGGENSPSVSPGSRSEGSVKDVGDAACVKKTSKKDGSRR